jgi:micrococcal nuclease
VKGQLVSLAYPESCTDRYDRLLAYVNVADVDVNRKLIDEGLACVLYIPPDGADRKDELLAAQEKARLAGKGLWSACSTSPCD